LLHVINHLEPADAGTIFIDDRPVYRYEREGHRVHEPGVPTDVTQGIAEQ
jgi:hypothetical protein